MKTTLAYGLAALVALTALAFAPTASAEVDIERCKSTYTPEFPEIDPCVHVQVDPSDPFPIGDCLVRVWIEDVGGIHCFP